MCRAFKRGKDRERESNAEYHNIYMYVRKQKDSIADLLASHMFKQVSGQASSRFVDMHRIYCDEPGGRPIDPAASKDLSCVGGA